MQHILKLLGLYLYGIVCISQRGSSSGFSFARGVELLEVFIEKFSDEGPGFGIKTIIIIVRVIVIVIIERECGGGYATVCTSAGDRCGIAQPKRTPTMDRQRRV